MKKTVLSLVAAAMLGIGGAASAAPLFQVNEGSVAGVNGSILDTAGVPKTFTADSFGSKYEERLQITGANTFTSTAFFNNFVFANTNVGPANPAGYLQQNEFVGGYNLYGTFTSSGTFATDLDGKTTFTGVTGRLELWSDAGQNTTLGYANANTINISKGGTTGDDKLLASSDTLLLALGEMKPSEQAGGFTIIFGGLELEAEGAAYFFDPSPFYAIVRTTGQFDRFEVPGLNGIVNVTGGSLDGTFNVPEPGSLALLGLGLAGLGLAQRRRKTAV